jgi:hypothetical protein
MVAHSGKSIAVAEPTDRADLTSDIGFRKRVYALLGKPTVGKCQFQARDGKWAFTRGKPISATNFYQHLSGVRTWAVSPLRKSGNGDGLVVASFVCLDIDESSDRRLPILDWIIKGRGWDGAAWATTGSEPGRAKVVLSLLHPIAHMQAKRLADDLLSEARESILWGTERKTTSVFPRLGSSEGSVVRVLGRNRMRTHDGHLDVPTMLNGRPSDLSEVAPVLLPAAIYPTIYPGIDSGVYSTSHVEQTPRESVCYGQPEVYSGDGDTMARDALRCAWHCVRLYGLGGNARDAFYSWCDGIAASKATSGAKEQAGRRDFRERTYARVGDALSSGRGRTSSDRLGDWRPLAPDDFKDKRRFNKTPLRFARRVYHAATSWIVKNRLDPHCVGFSYGHLARLARYADGDKSTARQAVDAAERAGLLFRLDRGATTQETPGGLMTLYTFVGKGESLQSAYDIGSAADVYRQRVAERTSMGLGSPRGSVVAGVAIFPQKPRIEQPTKVAA